MILTERKAKIISYIILLLMIVAIVGLSCMYSKTHKTLKIKESRIELLMNEVDSLRKLNKELGNEDCITINCNVNIKNTAVFSATNIHADAIATSIASITRQELLNARDSLDNIKLDTITTQNGAKVIVGNKKK